LQGNGTGSTIDVVNAATTLTLSQALGNNGAGKGFTKAGDGTLALNGANTYDGGTVISAGTLKVGNDSALGTTDSGTTVESAGKLDLDGHNIGNEVVTLNGGTMINSSSSSDAYSYKLVVSGSGTVGAMGAKWMCIRNVSGTGTLTIKNDSSAGIWTDNSTIWEHSGGTILNSGSVHLMRLPQSLTDRSQLTEDSLTSVPPMLLPTTWQ
jgi:autotransporter-associated beta strand protein